ncbi:hypothetical protein WHR41_06433 [Cladosporium halotolerans]|uniref:Conserved oligomeric Golgi complex subunit 8 n=1 Tax=Cladosporium halotolerans TaxID=1052096 RepID=A0AB34KNF6_9PEZI
MDPLYEVIAPHIQRDEHSATKPVPPTSNAQITTYLNRLGTLSLSDLTSTEPASLLQNAQSHVRNLQALSKRSHKAIISSASYLEKLQDLLPGFGQKAGQLKEELPQLESAASDFAKKYDRSTDNEVLERRKRAMLLSRNVDRVSDVLELPSLLSSTVAAAQASSSTSASTSATSYASALDLHAHIKRLMGLYPNSELIAGISKQAEAEINDLTTILITTLQSPGLKLATAMRTVGWLRRVALELADDSATPSKPATALSTRSFDVSSTHRPDDGALGSLFLVCRLHALHAMFSALEPLRDLADQESAQRPTQPQKQTPQNSTTSSSSAFGTQTERYLKRYLELFREQSFAILSMYRSVFPPDSSSPQTPTTNQDPLLPLPPPVSSFALHLVSLLQDTLRAYLPNIPDKPARESLLTQVLYCAGSLGRLGADFGLMIAVLEEEGEGAAAGGEGAEPEWVQVVRKHRVQASRLEVLARGVGSGGARKAVSPGAGVVAG